MNTHSARHGARALLVLVVVVAMVAAAGRHAEAQSYFVPQEQLVTIPASWGAYTAWAQYVAGGTVTTAGGGTVAAVGAIAAPAGGALAGGLVGAKCFRDLEANTTGEISDMDAALCVPRMAWGLVEGLFTRWTDPDPDPTGYGEATTCGGDYCSPEPLTITPAAGCNGSGPNGEWLVKANGGLQGCWLYTNERSVTENMSGTVWCTNGAGSKAEAFGFGTVTMAPGYAFTYGVSCPGTDPYPVAHGVRSGAPAHWRQTEATQAGTVTRRMQVEVECRDPVTGVRRTETVTVEYTADDLDAQGRVMLDLPEVTCGPGERVEGVEVVRRAAGGELPERTIGVGATPDQMNDPTDQYADCWTAASPCKVMLYRVDGATRYDCNTYGDLCSDWTSEPDRDTLYECRFGQYQPGADGMNMPHVLPLSDCFYLERAFDDGTLTQTHDGDPDGDTEEAPAPAPDSNVFRSALRWAFAPSETTMSRVHEVRKDAKTRAPFSYMVEVGGAIGGLGTVGNDCWAVSVNLDGPTMGVQGGDHAIIDSCGNNAVWAWFQAQRPFLTVLVWAFFVTPFAWWAWRQYAPGSQGSA